MDVVVWMWVLGVGVRRKTKHTFDRCIGLGFGRHVFAALDQGFPAYALNKAGLVSALNVIMC